MTSLTMTSNYTPAALAEVDYGARFLTELIRLEKPFFFLRFGDGFLECVEKKPGMTCDLEKYSEPLAESLLTAWYSVVNRSDLILGDWQTAAFTAADEYSRYREQYEALIFPHRPHRIHFESLLLMRTSEALVNFYRTVRNDKRRKLFMGPEGNKGAADMLKADFLPVPMDNLYEYRKDIAQALHSRDFDILLYGAGMAGNIPVITHAYGRDNVTYVNLGSAMDPLFRGTSRRQQLPPSVLREMFAELLID